MSVQTLQGKVVLTNEQFMEMTFNRDLKQTLKKFFINQISEELTQSDFIKISNPVNDPHTQSMEFILEITVSN